MQYGKMYIILNYQVRICRTSVMHQSSYHLNQLHANLVIVLLCQYVNM